MSLTAPWQMPGSCGRSSHLQQSNHNSCRPWRGLPVEFPVGPNMNSTIHKCYEAGHPASDKHIGCNNAWQGRVCCNRPRRPLHSHTFLTCSAHFMYDTEGRKERNYIHPTPAGSIRVLLFKQRSMELRTSTDVACYRKLVLLPCDHLHGISYRKQRQVRSLTFMSVAQAGQTIART